MPSGDRDSIRRIPYISGKLTKIQIEMDKTLTVQKKTIIQATAAKVWEAMTDPDKVRQYFFGTNVSSDWKVGKPIIFYGEFNGKAYRDKGSILEVDPGKLLRYDYWSGWSGLEDKPENYSIVTYTLEEKNGITHVGLIQQGFANEKAREHAESSWDIVLEQMKSLIERNT
jgi:uncharacterized protein YndB with AHSA1/START domain